MPARYTILGPIAKGGMACVYLGRMIGSAGFSRPVAIKRLHPELAAQRDFVAMLIDEARLAAQIRHANVVATLDLVANDGAFNLVLEYVEGESLSALIRHADLNGEKVPRRIALAILYGVLRGLDAAHDVRNDEGQPLGIVHRDVSPQNILVGIDGVPRIIDFGVAKARGRIETTRPGEVRGKFAYMAPEQLLARPVTRQVDVYAAGVLLWELLVGQRLFTADDERALCAAVLRGAIQPPSELNPEIPPELDAVVARATARELSDRYLTAREFLSALEPWETASDDEVGAWVRRLSARRLAERNRMLQDATDPEVKSVEELMASLSTTSVPTPHGFPIQDLVRQPFVLSSKSTADLKGVADIVRNGAPGALRELVGSGDILGQSLLPTPPVDANASDRGSRRLSAPPPPQRTSRPSVGVSEPRSPNADRASSSLRPPAPSHPSERPQSQHSLASSHPSARLPSQRTPASSHPSARAPSQRPLASSHPSARLPSQRPPASSYPSARPSQPRPSNPSSAALPSRRSSHPGRSNSSLPNGSRPSLHPSVPEYGNAYVDSHGSSARGSSAGVRPSSSPGSLPSNPGSLPSNPSWPPSSPPDFAPFDFAPLAPEPTPSGALRPAPMSGTLASPLATEMSVVATERRASAGRRMRASLVLLGFAITVMLGGALVAVRQRMRAPHDIVFPAATAAPAETSMPAPLLAATAEGVPAAPESSETAEPSSPPGASPPQVASMTAPTATSTSPSRAPAAKVKSRPPRPRASGAAIDPKGYR